MKCSVETKSVSIDWVDKKVELCDWEGEKHVLDFCMMEVELLDGSERLKTMMDVHSLHTYMMRGCAIISMAFEE